MHAAPLALNPLTGADRADLIPLQNAHVLPRFGRADGHAVLFENSLQRRHRSETPEIDGGSRPIQNYRGDVLISQDVFPSSKPLFQRKVKSPPAATAHSTKNVKSWSQPNRLTIMATT